MFDDLPVTSAEFFDKPATKYSPKAEKRKTLKGESEVKQARRMPKPVEPRTENQALYIKSLLNNELTFASGPAGVGKTYIPSRVYGELLAAKKIEKIYVARPNVAKAKHRNGFLPGGIEDKTEPWLIPIFEGLKESMSPFQFESFRKEKLIEEVPFEFIQGRTFKNAACIIDEAENLDLDDLYITLTRQGENLKMVICGDIYQARIPDSGLAKTIQMAKSPYIENVGIVEFTDADVTRSRQARQWVHAFRDHWAGKFA
jgi:phosphate starvation-inducible PhoH-like protein